MEDAPALDTVRVIPGGVELHALNLFVLVGVTMEDVQCQENALVTEVGLVQGVRQQCATHHVLMEDAYVQTNAVVIMVGLDPYAQHLSAAHPVSMEHALVQDNAAVTVVGVGPDVVMLCAVHHVSMEGALHQIIAHAVLDGQDLFVTQSNAWEKREKHG